MGISSADEFLVIKLGRIVINCGTKQL